MPFLALCFILIPIALGYSAPKNSTDPKGTNDTIPEPPVIVVDYEEKYLELIEDYERQRIDLESVLADNPIIYFQYIETIDDLDYIFFRPYRTKTFEDQIKLHNPAYGEDETSLGQVVDNFEDMSLIAVNVSVERNSTLEAMELNFTVGTAAFENFTTYTEVDEDGDVTVFDGNITWSSMRRDAETYVWKDFNPNYFGDFVHTFEVNITDVEAGDATSATIGVFSLLSNNTGVMDDLQASNWLGIALAQRTNQDDRYYFHLWERDGGATVDIDSSLLNWDVPETVYITFNRTGNLVTALFHSDAARTVLKDRLDITGNGKTYRYHEPLANSGRAVDPADHQSGYLVNMLLGGIADAYDASGYFITENYLSDPLANGQTLVEMTNCTIPANTEIRISFSLDNSTWVNNLGVAGFNTLIDGFLSLDLRNLNYSTAYYSMWNLSTTDTSITPRAYQSRLITTQGASVGGGVNRPTNLIVGGLIIIIVAVFIGVKKR